MCAGTLAFKLFVCSPLDLMIATMIATTILVLYCCTRNWTRLGQLSSRMETALALGPTLLGVLGYSKTGQQLQSFGFPVANPPPHAIGSYRARSLFTSRLMARAHGYGKEKWTSFIWGPPLRLVTRAIVSRLGSDQHLSTHPLSTRYYTPQMTEFKPTYGCGAFEYFCAAPSNGSNE